MKSIIAPVTRAGSQSASCSTTVVSQSCAFSASRIGAVGRRTPAPMIAQSMVLAGVEQIVEIDRLMGAVKIADADMHDARRQDRCGL